MTARRLTITADPAACVAGLAMLAELSRAGRSDLDGAIAALAQVVDKGDAKAPLRNWRSAPVHLARNADEGDRYVTTWCGAEVGVDSQSSRGRCAVFECVTTVGNLVDVTDDPALVTCARCQKGVAKKSTPR